MASSKFVRKIKSLVTVACCGGLLMNGILYYRNDEKYFSQLLMPTSRVLMSTENARKFSIFLCKWNLIPKNEYQDSSVLVSCNEYFFILHQ